MASTTRCWSRAASPFGASLAPCLGAKGPKFHSVRMIRLWNWIARNCVIVIKYIYIYYIYIIYILYIYILYTTIIMYSYGLKSVEAPHPSNLRFRCRNLLSFLAPIAVQFFWSPWRCLDVRQTNQFWNRYRVWMCLDEPWMGNSHEEGTVIPYASTSFNHKQVVCDGTGWRLLYPQALADVNNDFGWL